MLPCQLSIHNQPRQSLLSILSRSFLDLPAATFNFPNRETAEETKKNTRNYFQSLMSAIYLAINQGCPIHFRSSKQAAKKILPFRNELLLIRFGFILSRRKHNIIIARCHKSPTAKLFFHILWCNKTHIYPLEIMEQTYGLKRRAEFYDISKPSFNVQCIHFPDLMPQLDLLRLNRKPRIKKCLELDGELNLHHSVNSNVWKQDLVSIITI